MSLRPNENEDETTKKRLWWGDVLFHNKRVVLCRDASKKEAILTIVQFNVHAIMEFI